MKYLIVGLGNIGAEYAETRHNIGFKVADALAAEAGAVFATGRYGSVAEFRHKGRTFVLLKPSTYMNLSGKAVSYWLKAEKIPQENLLVVVGHNGLKSIAELFGNSDYARLRFGIGGDFPKGFQVDYVLGEWTPDERAALPGRIGTAAEAVLSFGTAGLERTMNGFNSK